MVDPVALARDLIRRPLGDARPTPAPWTCLQQALERPGLRLPAAEVRRDREHLRPPRRRPAPTSASAAIPTWCLWATRRPGARSPFSAEVVDGVLYGRGAVDMKGAVAAFVAAASNLLAEGASPGAPSRCWSPATKRGRGHDGARRIVDLLNGEGERVDHCLVGEPTSSRDLGDMIKVGRRGSLNAVVTVVGVQGHVALSATGREPRAGAAGVPATASRPARWTTAIRSSSPPAWRSPTWRSAIPAHNVIPARASAKLNIRFNPTWKGAELSAWLEEERAPGGGELRRNRRPRHQDVRRGLLHGTRRLRGPGRRRVRESGDRAARPSCPPPAAPPTPASSARSAPWWS